MRINPVPVHQKGTKRKRKKESVSADPLIQRAIAKGTDEEFRQWVQKQASCISGQFSEWLPTAGEWRNPACHVRRAGRSGTAYKEDYACVPMTHGEHALQTNGGESACLNRYLSKTTPWTNDEAKAWFDTRRIETLEKWIAS